MLHNSDPSGNRQEHVPNPAKTSLAEANEAATPGPVIQCLADVEPVDVQWLWPGREPLGRITMFVGRPDSGKSYLTLDMAARITLGRAWPDGGECPQGSVLLLCAEDNPAEPWGD